MSTQSVTTPFMAPFGRVDRQVNDVKVRNWLLDALTVSSGAVDAVSFLALGKVFTAFVTGNVAFLGMAIASTTGSTIYGVVAPRMIWVLASLAGFAGSVLDVVHPLPIISGLALLFGYAVLGGGWLKLKSNLSLQAFANRSIRVSAPFFAILFGIASIYAVRIQPSIREKWASQGIALACLVGLFVHIGFSGAKRLSRDGKRDDSETPTSMVLCNLRIVPEYLCSSGDGHPNVITVDILMCLTPERGPRKRESAREQSKQGQRARLLCSPVQVTISHNESS